MLNRNIFTFPLKILGDSGFEENLHELPPVHDVLGDQVDVPVSIVAELFVRLLLLSENLPQVGQVDRCPLASVVRVAIDVQNLLA